MQVGLQVTIAQQRQLCRMTTNGVRLLKEYTYDPEGYGKPF